MDHKFSLPKFRNEIFQYAIIKSDAKPSCIVELTILHLHSYLGMRGYIKGLGAMLAKERMAASEKGYENGLGAMSAAKAAAKATKWTVEVNASIERMIDDGVSFTKIASKLGNGLSKNDIINRWHKDSKKSSSIIKPAVPGGLPSRFTWTEDVDETIVRMRTDGVSFAKIASELGNGLAKHDIMNRWNRHLKDK